jgi:hypothetical protein
MMEQGTLANEDISVEGVTLLLREPRHFAVAHWNDVAFVHWKEKADGVAMERVHEALRSVVTDHPLGVSFVHVAQDGTGLPNADARRELSRMMAEFADATVCVGVLLLGNGFWASAMQSALTGLRLLAPPRRWPMRFGTRGPEMADWIAKQHEQRTHRVIAPTALEMLILQIIAAP